MAYYSGSRKHVIMKIKSKQMKLGKKASQVKCFRTRNTNMICTHLNAEISYYINENQDLVLHCIKSQSFIIEQISGDSRERERDLSSYG